MFLMGVGQVWKQERPLHWFLLMETSFHTKISSHLFGVARVALLTRDWIVSASLLSVIAQCLSLTTGQHSCTKAEGSRIVLAILHQTVSYSDCIVLGVVSTNVMRKLLI